MIFKLATLLRLTKLSKLISRQFSAVWYILQDTMTGLLKFGSLAFVIWVYHNVILNSTSDYNSIHSHANQPGWYCTRHILARWILTHLCPEGELSVRTSYFIKEQSREDEADEWAQCGPHQGQHRLNCVREYWWENETWEPQHASPNSRPLIDNQLLLNFSVNWNRVFWVHIKTTERLMLIPNTN